MGEDESMWQHFKQIVRGVRTPVLATLMALVAAPCLVGAAQAAPVLSIDDVTQVERNAGTSSFIFTVSLSQPADPGGVTFDISTANGTASGGSDYFPKSLTGQTIPAGSSTYSFSVIVYGDTDIEGDETFFVNVVNVVGATVSTSQGIGTILNDDHPVSPAPAITPSVIENFLASRASLVLANQPDIERRIDRLNGSAAAGGNPVSSLMSYMPGVVEGGPLAVSTSLGAIDRLAGNAQPSPFDIWLEGSFALFEANGPHGTFNTVSLGADYLLSSDLLIGGFVQIDRLSQTSKLAPATISGTGWLAGPYATARLSDHLYLDLVAAAGTASNTVNPSGTYEDRFDATRWMLSAALQGQWQWENWTFSPRAKLGYFGETTGAYKDSLGVDIPSITASLGQIAVGPAISYRYTTQGNVVIDTGLRFEGIADLTSTASGLNNLHARIEGTIDLSLPGGARIGLATAYDGIGSNQRRAASAKVTISLPMQ